MGKRIIKVDNLAEMMSGMYYRHYDQPVTGAITLSVKVGKRRRLLNGKLAHDELDVIHSRGALANYLYLYKFVPNNLEKAKNILRQIG